ncbi:MAG: Type 1 glutamine amidotransferase-like domain-containing protein [Patescibacteria group bacterium]
MKLFLTSVAVNVLDKIIPLLPKNPRELSVAFIPTAATPYESREWMDDDRNKLIKIGFNVIDFDLNSKTEEKVRETLSKVDIVFVAGGNTFYLLEKVRQSGFDKVVKDLINKGLIYIGSSAGSIILGPTIEPIKYLDDRSKAPDLSDDYGMKFIDFIVLPHFDNKQYDQAYRELMSEYKDKYRLEPLADNQVIVIDGDKFEILNS